MAVQKAQGTKLIWVTTTPVPTVPTYSADGPCNKTSKCLNPPRFDADVRLYNAAAAKIMASANANGAAITTLDLYQVVIDACGGAAASRSQRITSRGLGVSKWSQQRDLRFVLRPSTDNCWVLRNTSQIQNT